MVGVAGFEPATPSSRTRCISTAALKIQLARAAHRVRRRDPRLALPRASARLQSHAVVKVVVPTPMPSIEPVPGFDLSSSRRECAFLFRQKSFFNGGFLAVGVVDGRRRQRKEAGT